PVRKHPNRRGQMQRHHRSWLWACRWRSRALDLRQTIPYCPSGGCPALARAPHLDTRQGRKVKFGYGGRMSVDPISPVCEALVGGRLNEASALVTRDWNLGLEIEFHRVDLGTHFSVVRWVTSDGRGVVEIGLSLLGDWGPFFANLFAVRLLLMLPVL